MAALERIVHEYPVVEFYGPALLQEAVIAAEEMDERAAGYLHLITYADPRVTTVSVESIRSMLE